MTEHPGHAKLREIRAQGFYTDPETNKSYRIRTDIVGATDMKPGDKYVAGRNTGPHLLTVKQVYDEAAAKAVGGIYFNWIVPEEEATYSFDFNECIPVILTTETLTNSEGTVL